MNDIPGWMSDEELAWLEQQASQFQSVVEIGCWKGRSAYALASGCKGRVWTVDHFQGSPSEPDTHAEARTENLYAIAQNNLPFQHVKVLPYDSLSAARLISVPVDMVFLDGEHTFEAVLRDLVLWAPKCTRLLCGHDRDFDGVQKALAVYGIPFEAGAGSIWYMEKLV